MYCTPIRLQTRGSKVQTLAFLLFVHGEFIFYLSLTFRQSSFRKMHIVVIQLLDFLDIKRAQKRDFKFLTYLFFTLFHCFFWVQNDHLNGLYFCCILIKKGSKRGQNFDNSHIWKEYRMLIFNPILMCFFFNILN